MSAEPRLIQVRQHILKQNDVVARRLRQRFREAGVFVVSLVSSPGTGKTTFLERLLGLLRARYRVAALVGDLATDNDAQRLARAQVPHSGRSPPARFAISRPRWSRTRWRDGSWTSWIFCSLKTSAISSAPRAYDLGEALRVVLLSVTEGEDKPLKYPPIFNSADVAVITKIDLAMAVEFDRAVANQSIQSVRPGMEVFEVSAKTGQGMEDWVLFLQSRLVGSRQHVFATAATQAGN